MSKVKCYVRFLVGSFLFAGLGILLWGCGSGSSSSKKGAPIVKIIVAGQKDTMMASGSKWWIKGFSDNGLEDTDHWNKVFPDGKAFASAVDSLGNVYVAGYIISGNNCRWLIKKFSSTGAEYPGWNKEIDAGSGVPDYVYALAVDSDNNLYVAGTKAGLNGDTDWLIKKFSPDGVEDKVNWNKSCDGGASEEDTPTSIVIDPGNNIYVAGKLTVNGDRKGLIKKYTSNGTEDTNNWNRVFDVGISAIAIDPNNNIYVAGFKVNASADWWIAKLTKDGNEVWSKTIDGKGEIDIAYSITIDSNRNIYAAGFQTIGGKQTWCIKKFSESGVEDTTNWNKTYPDIEGSVESVFYYANNIYVAGWQKNINYDWHLKKFSVDGIEDTTQWNLTFDGGVGDDYAGSIVVWK